MTSGTTTKAVYHWLSDGTKYKVTDPAGNGVIYAGDLTYTATVSGGNTTYALESAEASADGTARFLKNGTAMTPYYTIKDHLGSVRTIVNASGSVVERNDYYPFGQRTTFGASYATLATNRQKFSGKEDQTAVAGATLPYLDFGARMYDAKLVRWNTYDPMAEKYYGINPYVYCAGNPVMIIDPEGMDTWDINSLGEITNRKRDKNADTFNLVNDEGNTFKSISFNYGTVTSTKKKNKFWGRDVTSISTVSENKGAELFKFFADNLHIEFGLILMGQKGSEIVTSHKEHRVPVSREAEKLNKKRDTTVSAIIHNHPDNHDPSGFDSKKPKDEGDKGAFSILPKAKHYVYLPGSEELIEYTKSNKIESRKKWNEVFPEE